MKIVQLTAENIQKLRAVEITPTGQVVTIAGKNGAGKSSLLNSIWLALKAADAGIGMPIRKGKDKAHVRLALGNGSNVQLLVERRFTDKGSTLIVESADGARYQSPQGLLDKIIGALSFDPLAFARMEPRKQFDELRQVVHLDVDLDKLKGLNRADYDRRTDINREAKAARAQAEGAHVPARPKGEAIDETALVDDLERAGKQNADIQTQQQKRDAAQERLTRILADAQRANERAAKMRAEAQSECEAALARAEAALRKALADADGVEQDAQTAIAEAERIEKALAEAPALPTPIDVSALRQTIDAARTTNRAIREHEMAIDKRAALLDSAQTLEQRAADLTAQIDARAKAGEDAIARAQMPVAGLGFGDGHITYNGIPFDQCSSAEQLRVSMAIAMSANPKLRVIRITDGSLLDDDSMAAIAEMATANDFQFWIERVDGSGKVGIVIEDGSVVSTPESRSEVVAEGHTA